MAAAVGLPRVVSAAATRAAGDDTTDRAELHGSARPSKKARVLTLVTLVTLDCGPFDIVKSVAGGNHEELPLRAPDHAGVDIAHQALARLTARAYPGSQQAGGPGSRCGSDQRAVMRLRVGPKWADSYSPRVLRLRDHVSPKAQEPRP